MTLFAFSKWVELVLSTKVMARLKAVLLPLSISAINASAEGCALLNF
jgi:hypothetical protein